MRRLLLLLVTVLTLTGCGGEDRPAAGERSHLDPASDVVVAVSLDYDGADWTALKELYARWQRDDALSEVTGAGLSLPGELDGLLDFLGRYAGVAFRDVRPALGGVLLLGFAADGEAVLQYTAPDAGALERLVAQQPGLTGPGTSLEGGTLVVVLDAGGRSPEAVLDERLASDAGPVLPEVEGALAGVRVAASVGERAEPLAALAAGLSDASARLDADPGGLTLTGVADYGDTPTEEVPVGPAQELELAAGEGVRFGVADLGHTGSALTARLPRLAADLGVLERALVGIVRGTDVGVRLTGTDPAGIRRVLGRVLPVVGGEGELVTGATTDAVGERVGAVATKRAAGPAAVRLEIDTARWVQQAAGAVPAALTDLVSTVVATASAADGDIALDARATVP